MELNILEIILDSGVVVKLVLLSLIIASVVSWAIILKKYSFFKSMNEKNEKFLRIFGNAKSMAEVMEKTATMPTSSYKTMFLRGYSELQQIKTTINDKKDTTPKDYFKEFGFTSIERALSVGINDSNVISEKLLTTLASIGSITPFVGLFGTVWGIIDSFTGLAKGGASLTAVAPGIAEALVATAVGLIAAIPAVWFYNYFSNQNSELNTNMNSFYQRFLNVVERAIV